MIDSLLKRRELLLLVALLWVAVGVLLVLVLISTPLYTS
jgi:capsular polysaccharide biosynthesis protein